MPRLVCGIFHQHRLYANRRNHDPSTHAQPCMQNTRDVLQLKQSFALPRHALVEKLDVFGGLRRGINIKGKTKKVEFLVSARRVSKAS